MSRATAAPSATASAPVVARAGGRGRGRAGPGHPRAPAARSAALSRAPRDGCASSPSSRRSSPPRSASSAPCRCGPPPAPLERADHNTAQVVRSRPSTPTWSVPTPPRRARSSSAASRTPPSGPTTTRAWTASPRASPTRRTRSRPTATPSAPSTPRSRTTPRPIEEARVYNRQGLPVGAQYLSNASDTLRATSCPSSTTALTPTRPGPTRSSTRSSRLPVFVLVGLGALAVLVARHGLAGPAHPPLPQPVACSSAPSVLLAALAIGVVDAGVGRQPGTGRPQHRSSPTRSRSPIRPLRGVRREVEREPDPHHARFRGGLRDGLAEAVGQRRAVLKRPGPHDATRFRPTGRVQDAHEADPRGSTAAATGTRPSQQARPEPGRQVANAAFTTFDAAAAKARPSATTPTSRLTGPVTLGDHSRLAAARPLRSGAAVLMLRGHGPADRGVPMTTAPAPPGAPPSAARGVAALLRACSSGVYAETQLPTATAHPLLGPVAVRHRHGHPGDLRQRHPVLRPAAVPDRRRREQRGRGDPEQSERALRVGVSADSLPARLAQPPHRADRGLRHRHGQVRRARRSSATRTRSS